MIRVTFPIDELESIHHSTMKSIRLIEKLKAAGVPVVGAIMIQGIERGTLTMTRAANRDYLFEWEDDDI